MCPPCKVLLDGDETAIAADLLAATTTDHIVRVAAKDLATTARALVAAYEAAMKRGVVKLTDDFRWDGCHRATQIMAWVTTSRDYDSSVVDKLVAWRREMLLDVANLVSGAQPSL